MGNRYTTIHYNSIFVCLKCFKMKEEFCASGPLVKLDGTLGTWRTAQSLKQNLEMKDCGAVVLTCLFIMLLPHSWEILSSDDGRRRCVALQVCTGIPAHSCGGPPAPCCDLPVCWAKGTPLLLWQQCARPPRRLFQNIWCLLSGHGVLVRKKRRNPFMSSSSSLKGTTLYYGTGINKNYRRNKNP